MHHAIAKSQRKRLAGDKGFTLIELLVVVVIIGILVAIAVPVYLNYRKGASNKSAQSDVRAAISAIEQFYTENGNAYPVSAEATPADGKLTLKLAGTTPAEGTSTVSEGNTVKYKLSTTTGNTYIICGQNKDGLKVYVYNSTNGGSVKEFTSNDLSQCLATLT